VQVGEVMVAYEGKLVNWVRNIFSMKKYFDAGSSILIFWPIFFWNEFPRKRHTLIGTNCLYVMCGIT
jgi:hypothetical protein